MFKFYEVGGKVRDELLGLQSKDVDYVAVPLIDTAITADEMFTKLEEYLRSEGFEIFLVTAKCYTIRAKFPDNYKYKGTADFVMARKEIGYLPGTRQPIVVPGNLYDDLSRRDFTINAMAKDPDTGEIIDYFNGKTDLAMRVLRTPLEVTKTLNDDPLRILRAIRFSITKNFSYSPVLEKAIRQYNYSEKMKVVSSSRIREELHKCFKHNTPMTLCQLKEFSNLSDYIFRHTDLWLKPTNEK